MPNRQKIFSKDLSSALLNDKRQLVAALADFWHSIGFQRHWSAPPFLYVDVKEQISNAADTVVRIRAHCRRKHSEMRDTHTAGAGIEYLWSVHKLPENLEAFEDELIHACLMDSKGYVAPLDESLVNQYIAEIRHYRAERLKQKVAPDVKVELEALQLLLEEITPELKRDEASMKGVIEKVRELNKYMEEIAKRQKDVAEAARKHQEHLKAEEEEKKRKLQEAEEAAQKQAATAAAQQEEASSSESEESSQASEGSSSERERMKASIDREREEEGKKILTIKKIADKTDSIEKDVRAFEELDLKRLEDFNETMDPKERNGLIHRLKKKSLEYSVLLERELLALDGVQGEGIRPMRKEQVLKIQEALKHVERLQEKLKQFHEEHEASVEPELKRSKDEGEKEAAEEEPEEEEVAKGEQQQKPLLERFASMKLDPRFQVRDTQAAYVVSAYLPGIDEEALNISLNDAQDVLTCSGRRLPSEAELEKMRYALRQKYDYPEDQEDELLLRYGAGRFGSFSEKWRIDSNSTNPDAIEASFERGNLQLVIPKISKRRPQPRYNTNRNYGNSPFYW